MTGCSGAVGQQVVRQLLTINAITELHIVSRRSTANQKPKMHQHIIHNLTATPEFHLNTPIDHYICTLGSTIKSAGSRSAFYSVDHDLILQWAKTAQHLGARSMSAISSIGANPRSNNFYLQTKGHMELALQSLNYKALALFRPSLLVGPRPKFRPTERIGGYVSQIINPLLLGPTSRFRSISMQTLADAIVFDAIQSPSVKTKTHINPEFCDIVL